jgi:hypothetical protein
MIPHPLAAISTAAQLSALLIKRLCVASVALSANAYESPSARAKYQRRTAPRAQAVCERVAQRAQEEGLNPLELIAVSHTETRHTPRLTSSAGAVGPLQVRLVFWRRPRDRSQDTITPALRAWAYYRARSSSLREAAGRYNGGGSSSAYAAQVEAHHAHLKRHLDTMSTHTGGATP